MTRSGGLFLCAAMTLLGTASSLGCGRETVLDASGFESHALLPITSPSEDPLLGLDLPPPAPPQTPDYFFFKKSYRLTPTHPYFDIAVQAEFPPVKDVLMVHSVGLSCCVDADRLVTFVGLNDTPLALSIVENTSGDKTITASISRQIWARNGRFQFFHSNFGFGQMVCDLTIRGKFWRDSE